METRNKVTPTTKQELRKIIEQELKRQGDEVDLNFIDTSQITDMSWLFYELDVGIIRIGQWDVSNVTDMSCMFCGCKNLWANLSKWDVSNVTDMHSMFCDATCFNSDLSNWKVSKVMDTSFMFCRAKSFTSSISNWPLSYRCNTDFMLLQCPLDGCKGSLRFSNHYYDSIQRDNYSAYYDY